MSIVRGEARAEKTRGTAAVRLDEALGRVLAGEVISPIDSPPFDKSTRDGIALVAGDTSTELRILDTLAAGGAPGPALRRGECARIMTGAALPPGAARVISKENVEERAGTARVLQNESGDNVVRRGAHLARGQVVMGPKVLAAQDIGALAASGLAEVCVAVPPSTGIICTGPEIRAAGQPLDRGQIYDSNGPQLAAQLAAMHSPGLQRGIVIDERSSFPAPSRWHSMRTSWSSSPAAFRGGLRLCPAMPRGAGSAHPLPRHCRETGQANPVRASRRLLGFRPSGKPRFHVRDLRSPGETISLRPHGHRLGAAGVSGHSRRGRATRRRRAHGVSSRPCTGRRRDTRHLSWIHACERAGGGRRDDTD